MFHYEFGRIKTLRKRFLQTRTVHLCWNCNSSYIKYHFWKPQCQQAWMKQDWRKLLEKWQDDILVLFLIKMSNLVFYFSINFLTLTIVSNKQRFSWWNPLQGFPQIFLVEYITRATLKAEKKCRTQFWRLKPARIMFLSSRISTAKSIQQFIE